MVEVTQVLLQCRVLRALEDYFPQTMQPQLKKKDKMGMDSPMQNLEKLSIFPKVIRFT